MSEEMIAVNYNFSARDTMIGSMKIPARLFNEKNPDEAWSEAAETYISDNHDFQLQPAEIDEDFEFGDIAKV